MAKKFSKPELSRKINGDIPFDGAKQEPEAELYRLDIKTLEQYPRYSRATIQKFIKDGRVKVNGEVAKKPNTLIEDGAEIELELPKEPNGEKPPVIYEDDNVIVFNKPAGLLSIKKGDY